MTPYKRALGCLLALAATAGVTLGALPDDARARPKTTASATGDHPQLRALLHRLTTADGSPGALVTLRDRSGGTVLTSGLADVRRHTPVRADSRFRIGSMTKPFVATVVLQLVGEGRVVLDAPVERYLPGVVRGHGNDGRKITVRRLLQHTSGLSDYLNHLKPQGVIDDPLAHHDTRDLVRLALAHRPDFAPGTDVRCSSTGYLLAGMLIERVTGHTYGQEIRRRVIEPLHLRRTSVPGDAPGISGPHPRGYVRTHKDAPLKGSTALNPTFAGPSGSMISSGADMNRFMDALVRGKLLRPAQLRQMMNTRPTGSPDGGAYGLGLESHPLPCGGLARGYDGGVPGYQTIGAVTVDGRQATAMANVFPGETDAQDDDMRAAIPMALCEDGPSP
ncbi:beta-lactamase family protein [Streptomyces sp. NBC_01283]|uniref:serine hydrolase domain-containing protein n=1 Tax=Streptomyces sp. NBC_01283 TaxID=2903812 RepID=UPI00352C84D2|nr:beta-lactamase family protein [Streptomyces sp. NBC_01283]